MAAPDYSRAMGGQALGARLRRLSERIDRDSARAYAASGVVFEQRWYGLINQLQLKGAMTVGDLAGTLKITHVSVSQASQALEKAGLVSSSPDPDDARRRRLELTAAGQALVDRLAPLWAAFGQAAAQLDTEAGNVIAALDRLDDALSQRSLFERINACLETPMGDGTAEAITSNTSVD